MTLKGQIQNDMKDAMRAGDKDRLKAIRLVLAAIKQVEVDSRVDVDDAGVLRILDKMLKQRRDSIEQFRSGSREDLAQIELAEIAVLETYTPEPLADDELQILIADAIRDSSATNIRDMGKVMARLRETTGGRADMASVGSKVKASLSG
ncbi:MAG: GatB/YqeY domain-containing protein [Woeseia sp.]